MWRHNLLPTPSPGLSLLPPYHPTSLPSPGRLSGTIILPACTCGRRQVFLFSFCPYLLQHRRLTTLAHDIVFAVVIDSWLPVLFINNASWHALISDFRSWNCKLGGGWGGVARGKKGKGGEGPWARNLPFIESLDRQKPGIVVLTTIIVSGTCRRLDFKEQSMHFTLAAHLLWRLVVVSLSYPEILIFFPCLLLPVRPS